MGQPKLLLRWGPTTVIGHLLRLWEELGARQLAIVHAAADAGMMRELDRLAVAAEARIVNPNPDQGMFGSIRCAAWWTGWRPELAAVVIALGDQPHLRPTTLETLLSFARAHPERICQPSRAGRARHPVVFPMAWLVALREAPVTRLKEFLAVHENRRDLVELDDGGLDLDIDSPEDYQKALAWAALQRQLST